MRTVYEVAVRPKATELARGSVRSGIQVPEREGTQGNLGMVACLYEDQVFWIINHREAKMSNLLNTREKTHGNYRDNANLSQAIKDVLRSGKNWERLSDGQKEALEMISVKLARLLSGDKDFRDHWDDIEGYAKLGGQASPTNLPTVTLDLTKAMEG